MWESSSKPTTIKNTNGAQTASSNATAPICFKVERSETGFENLLLEPESGLIKPNASFKTIVTAMKTKVLASKLFNQSDLNPALQYPFKGTSDFFDALVIVSNDNLFAVQRG